MESRLVKYVKSTKKYKDIPRGIHKLFGDNTKTDYQHLNVAMYMNPCDGNGDISFATRIWEYLYKWFGIKAYTFTSRPSTFIKNDIIPSDLLYCVRDTSTLKPYDCVQTKHASVYTLDCSRRVKDFPKFDLFLVVPWVSEEIFTYKSLNKIFKESNAFNTYIFSAYNQDMHGDDQNFDFVSGLGKGRLGLTYIDVPKETEFKYGYLGEYILMHVSKTDTLDPLDCIRSFIKTMVLKYTKGVTFVLPKFLEKFPLLFKQLAAKLGVSMILHTSESTTVYGSGVEYHMRMDILPVGIKDFNSLIVNALPDFLMTGNQSVTDLISMRPSFSLYYQLTPWDGVFARQLNKLSGQFHLSNKKKSCGLGKISYNPVDYARVRSFDFRVLAYQKFKEILEYRSVARDSETLQKFEELWMGSRNKESLIKKITKEF